MRGLIVGTGPSLRDILPDINRFDGIIFTCNRTFLDVRTDVWLSCDKQLHEFYGKVEGDFDKWYWDAEICARYGYKFVEGVWIVDGVAYSRDDYITPPGPCGGLWMQDKSKISLNHCSAAQLLNLCLNQYECDEAILVGHDFNDTGKRHYFDNLSETRGEYPANLRKFSKFIKNNGTDDLLAVYKRIADQKGLPPIINCTPGSALPWFPMGDFKDYTA